jgi:hypothetical protein
LFIFLIGCTSLRAVGEPPVETVTPPPVVDPARSLLTGPPPGYVKPEIYWVREKIILGSEPAPPASATQKSVVKKGKKYKKTGKRLTEREATSLHEAMHVERSVKTEGLRGTDHRFIPLVPCAGLQGYQLQSLDPLEVAAVIGQEGEVMAQGGGPDEQIKVTDQLACGPETAAFAAKYLADLLVDPNKSNTREKIS